MAVHRFRPVAWQTLDAILRHSNLAPMYRWRRLTLEERRDVLAWRQLQRLPLQSPHHVDSGQRHYMLTASCFEHAPHIGHSVNRMNEFAGQWLDLLRQRSAGVAAWVLLPNHYHAVVSADNILSLLGSLGRLHGRSSFVWNGEEQARGRQVWCKAVETVIKSPEHYWATLNYVHHNPVKHGYVSKWEDWPWSSATDFLGDLGRTEAARLWRTYPIDTYGKGWDDPEL